jgi:hypothetical protein
MTRCEKHSRRAALGAIASLSALAAPGQAIAAASGLASPSTASPSHPDAELFALIDAARDADTRRVAASEACDEAEKRTEDVPPPDALIVTEDDTRLWKLNAGDPFDETHLDLMSQRQAHRRNAKSLRLFSDTLADAPYFATLNDKDRTLVEVMAATEAREDQLVVAHDQWKAARHEASVRSGELDAWNRSDELLDEKHKLWRRIMMMPAQTEAGMMAKLALVAPYFDAAELEDVEETADGILASVAVDFKTLNPALATV